LIQVSGNTYRVWREQDAARVNFEGSLRLSGSMAYMPIVQLLEEVGELGAETVILDLSKLQFLNSAGINMVYKFALNLNKKGGSKLIVYGSSSFPWQKKMLSHLDRFIDDLEVKYL
jgi:hypothetical protein